MLRLSLMLALISCEPAFAVAGTPVVTAPAYEVSKESFYCVVTWKDGVAARLAHNHLIVSKDADATLKFDPSNLALSSFDVKIPTEKLVVDDPAMQENLRPVLEDLGVTALFSQLSDKESAAVLTSMRSKDQLWIENSPLISASLSGLELKETHVGKRIFNHVAKLSVNIRSRTVEKTVPVSLQYKDGALLAEALGSFNFSEFGIVPYSAFLGAVKVKDQFALYVKVKAKKK